MNSSKLFLVLIVTCLMVFAPSYAAHAQNNQNEQMSSEAMMQQFAGELEESPERKIETQRKHEILFMMGIALLILLFMTGGLGVAMAAFDKEVFIAHTIVAGLTLTLAAVHAATSIAWFWPY